MRKAVGVAALSLSGIGASFVADRYIEAVPSWLFPVIAAASAVGGVVGLLATWPPVSEPFVRFTRRRRTMATVIVFAVCGAAGAAAWNLVSVLADDKNKDKALAAALDTINIVGRLPRDEAVFPLEIEVQTGIEMRSIEVDITIDQIVQGRLVQRRSGHHFRGYRERIGAGERAVFPYQPPGVSADDRGRPVPVQDARLTYVMHFSIPGHLGRHTFRGVLQLVRERHQPPRWEVTEIERR